MKKLLILEDGIISEGKVLGAKGNMVGEVVLTTGITGYQGVITDQGSNGQMVTFTYPLAKNYGVNRDDYESVAPTCKGAITKEHVRVASNWCQQIALDEFLKRKGIPRISGIDTCVLARKLRSAGTMRRNTASAVDDLSHAFDQLKATVMPESQVVQVPTTKPYPSPGIGCNVAVIDFGLKHNILQELSKRQCNLAMLSHNTTAEEILGLNPDGVTSTSGPGDPRDVPGAIGMVQEIQGKVPIFGICLGRQSFSLANGTDTYKMKFGHRGLNRSTREVATGRTGFISQNHRYVVDEATIDPEKLLVTRVEVNDGTVEGMHHRDYSASTVQCHPDTAPGPHDGLRLLDELMELMDAWKEQN